MDKTKQIEIYLSESQISERVRSLASEISQDFHGEDVTVICILNGAFMFCADLVRSIDLGVHLEFMAASSYGDGMVSSGQVDIKLDLKKSINGQNVIIVEDIIDTGLTVSSLLKELRLRGPKELKVCSLLYKPSKVQHKVPIDYLAFEIEDQFVIGYGLDFAGKYRELPYIGIYRENV